MRARPATSSARPRGPAAHGGDALLLLHGHGYTLHMSWGCCGRTRLSSMAAGSGALRATARRSSAQRVQWCSSPAGALPWYHRSTSLPCPVLASQGARGRAQAGLWRGAEGRHPAARGGRAAARRLCRLRPRARHGRQAHPHARRGRGVRAAQRRCAPAPCAVHVDVPCTSGSVASEQPTSSAVRSS